MTKYIMIVIIIICVVYEFIKSIRKYVNEKKKENFMATFIDEKGNSKHPYGIRNYSEDVSDEEVGNRHDESQAIITNDLKCNTEQDIECYSEYENYDDYVTNEDTEQEISCCDKKNTKKYNTENGNRKRKYRIY